MISRNTIDRLNEKAGKLNLTITLRTHKAGEEVRQNPIRFKNLLATAEKKLVRLGMKQQEVERWLHRPRQLLDDFNFWNHTDKGLALYISDETFELFALPYGLQENVYLQDHFLVTPLLPMISLNGSWHMLALGQKRLRLLRCTRESVSDVTPDDIFTDIEEFIEEKPEVQLQFHTASGNREAIFFGHGGSDEDKKTITRKYFHGVEESVTRVLRSSGDPLLLAGNEEAISIYRSLNKYERLMKPVVNGSPVEMKNEELRDAGWDVIRDHFLREMFQAIEQFGEEGNERTSTNLSKIATSTVMGRVDTLFIAMDESSWGVYDPSEHTVHHTHTDNGESVELLNWTALKALEQGGMVYVLPKDEMPASATIAALFRF